MSTQPGIVRLVVVFVGTATIVGLVGLIALVWHGGVDAGALAVVAGPTGTALGVLGAILAHTGSAPPADPVPAGVSSFAGGGGAAGGAGAGGAVVGGVGGGPGASSAAH